MYYETDGDAGYYHVKLFCYKEQAQAYQKKRGDSYGRVSEVEVDEGMPIKGMEGHEVRDENLCPDCGSKMVSRTGQFGTFWGCSTYPKCKGTRDSQGRSKAERGEWKRKQKDKEVMDDLDREVDAHDLSEGQKTSFKKRT